MKAVISSTYDNQYIFFLPITVWAWHKLNVDTICFLPYLETIEENKKIDLINDTFIKIGIKPQYVGFTAPEHKKATYAQCSRLYAACLDLPEDEVLISGDIDMLTFKTPETYKDGFTVWGSDLAPTGQFPMCYLSATVTEWRKAFNLNGITCQQALDRLLADDECQDYRACRWSVDQEQAFLNISKGNIYKITRSNGLNQFAQHRVDRTDTNWRAYVNEKLIDAHLWRPSYEEIEFNNLLELLKTKFPEENFEWMVEYKNSYVDLI